ncbi:hypothetical protein K501DRAFT_329123 [Backusella circina FSU 941]|nr:hypothetical protein K501DRAFT_329123 [Backusella circina FSU 941]
MSTYDEHKPQHYDIKMTPSIATLGCDLSYSLSLPPSYSQVMTEKYECESNNKGTKDDYIVTAWNNRLSEVKVAVENARQFINSTNEMMDKLRYHSIRLECKNEYFDEDLQRFFQNEESDLFNSTLYNIKKQSKNDQQNNAAEGLSRMNFLVEDLITEAQESLTKRIPHHIYSKESNADLHHKKSNTSKKTNDHHQLLKEKDSLYWKKYHKARYFRSQWKLIQTMKQLIETVQITVISEDQQQDQTKTLRHPTSSSATTITTTEAIPQSVQHHHIHHHYHHVYHHHPPTTSSPTSIIDTLKNQASHNTAAATLFFKQALRTVGIMHPTHIITINSPVKSRSILYGTLLLIYTLDYNMQLFRKRDYSILARGNKITMAWTQNARYKQLYEKWNQKAYLIMYLVRYIMLS